MGVYITLIIWSVVCASIFLTKISSDKKKKIYLILVYTPLIFISGFRNWDVGTDTILFHQWYNATANMDITFEWFATLSNGVPIEFGFAYIGYLLNSLYLDAQVMIFFVSLVTISGIGYTFYKYSSSIWLSTFLFIALFSYQESMNTARQYIAAMIMFNAYGYLKNNFKLKYLSMIIFSMMFHFTSIIHAILLFFMSINVKKIIYTMVFLGIIILGSWDYILIYVQSIAPKYLEYMNSEYTTARNLGPGIIQIFGILIIMIISLYLNCKKRFNVQEKKDLIIYNIFLFFYIVVIYIQYFLPIISRINPYVSLYIDMCIPLLLNKINTSYFIKYLLYIMIIIVGFVYCLYCMSIGKHEVVPYSFCF